MQRLQTKLEKYVDKLCKLQHIPTTFSKKTLAATAAIKSSKQPADFEDRTDWAYITIDGDDAKDFDDAIYARRDDNAWLLSVAIANVAHYIPENSVLDTVAMNRGNSIYLPHTVIPMLPPKLSEDLCSLLPYKNRLCLGIDLQIDKSGNLINYNLSQIIIKSQLRLTYGNCDLFFNNQYQIENAKVAQSLQQMQIVSNLRNKHRKAKGYLQLATAELKFKLSATHKLQEIYIAERFSSQKLVEEAMLLANTSVANFLASNNLGGVFRCHKPPAIDRLTNLNKVIRQFSVRCNLVDPKVSDFNNLIKKLPEKCVATVTTSIICSQSKATYENTAMPHFGLNEIQYCHATSPIRRYADLVVQRAIITNLAIITNSKNKAKNTEKLCLHINAIEERTLKLTRTVEKWLKCLYAKNMVGSKFLATITAVMPFGIFAEINSNKIEGLLHISNLGSDTWYYDDSKFVITNSKRSKVFKIGMQIIIVISKAELKSNKVGFRLNDRHKKRKKFRI